MPHRAEHASSSAAEHKSRGHHIETHRRAEHAKEGRRASVEHGRKAPVDELVTEDEKRAMEARRAINVLSKKPLEQEARKRAERLSESFFETYGVYPSQIASEDEAKKIWSKDTGFFRRLAVKLSGAENMEAMNAWKGWYEADQEMEAMKSASANVHVEERKKEHKQTAEDMKQLLEYPGKGLVDVASELISPKLAVDTAQVIREQGKVIAETKKVEEQIEAEAHRGKAARAAGMVLNRVGFIAQEQKGYEAFTFSSDQVEAMDLFTLESQLHRFDERIGKDGLAAMELAIASQPSDSKETHQHTKELQKNIKALNSTYDKQIDKFEEEYKAYLETPAGMQEALITALRHLETLRNQSLSLSAETLETYGDALLDEQRHMADIESALPTVKGRMNKEAGENVYSSSSQAKLFLSLQEGIQDLYEEQQKRVRASERQNAKSQIGMYGSKMDMPSVGSAGGSGSVEKLDRSLPVEAPIVEKTTARNKKKENAVVEPEPPVEDLTEELVLEEEGLNEEQRASLARYTNTIKTTDKKRRAELIEARIEKLKQERAKFARPAMQTEPEIVPAPVVEKVAEEKKEATKERPESRAARFLGKENAEHIKDLIEVAAQNFVEVAEHNKDDAGLQAELKELKLLAYRMELLPEKYAYQLGLAKTKQDEAAKKFIKRVNAILNIKTQAIAEVLRHKESLREAA